MEQWSNPASTNSDSEDERTIELRSIAAIYPELAISSTNPYAATLDISVNPLHPPRIRFVGSVLACNVSRPPTPVGINAGLDNDPTRDGILANDIHELEHLPALRLEIELPEGYPTEQPPFIRLSTSPQWISCRTLEELQSDCERLWEETGHDQTVFFVIDHLEQAADRAFDLVRHDHDITLPTNLQIALLDFNLQAKREVFNAQTFDCGICLEPKKGTHCHRLTSCGHVCCVACLQDFYNNCIKEGDVDHVKCTEPGCATHVVPVAEGLRARHHDLTISPTELLQIPIEYELVQRYVRLRRKKYMELKKNTVYCPRQWCQGFAHDGKQDSQRSAIYEPDFSNDDSEADGNAAAQRLAVCEDCDYAFCRVCQKGWHGDYVDCLPRDGAGLNAEEEATLEYLRHHSTACPKCKVPSQKAHGCNHMICVQCDTHFCYLCAAFLEVNNPYQHFNNRLNDCYLRLWEGEEGDGMQDGEDMDQDLDEGDEWPVGN